MSLWYSAHSQLHSYNSTVSHMHAQCSRIQTCTTIGQLHTSISQNKSCIGTSTLRTKQKKKCPLRLKAPRIHHSRHTKLLKCEARIPVKNHCALISMNANRSTTSQMEQHPAAETSLSLLDSNHHIEMMMFRPGLPWSLLA